jgi:ABC-2 type transport system ATP-binding protein
LARAEEILRFFGMWEMRNCKFKTLSKGLKRRLTIAAALVHNPEVLFLDEHTSRLDVMSRRLLWRKLRELNRMGVTIFLTAHNVYEAFSIS